MPEVKMEIVNGSAPDWINHRVPVRSEAAIAWLRHQGLLTIEEASKARARMASGTIDPARFPSEFDSHSEGFVPLRGDIPVVRPLKLDRNRKHRRVGHRATTAPSVPSDRSIKAPWEA